MKKNYEHLQFRGSGGGGGGGALYEAWSALSTVLLIISSISVVL